MTVCHSRTKDLPAVAREADILIRHAREHGMANACRLILNLNEFVFVN